nr:hypothetical protein [Tanacetum cinerariifolium]
MILNTLDHLGTFDAKGDEGYFIGYSMSSKAFRVFNKRTKRVEENLHVDFLKNKAIEKGAGLNWLFDIDSLTNSMNYVPVVVADTNSTNFSGTKEAAGQDVKKDVSSLRYIALPNWFHEAHLESSTSNAQDTCNAEAPESSGNSNPTATSTNPLANHMETLAVETPVPTVSSPVPTACFDDSPQLSSNSRLISKRVTSQDDTPSLDNILTLTNRFEDMLGVTTNTDDSNKVEADLGNMENNISASPTPTFRIHKDHPKSQIISHVDTPVQTRTKSKEMEEQSFIATIHQKTNLTLLQFCLFSWVRPIRTKWVLKNKKDERGILIRNKARLVAQGHTQEEGINYDEVFAPVARIEAIRLFLAYASFMGFTMYQMDVKSAFLYGTIDEEVYVMQPTGFQDLEFPARVYKVEKAIEFDVLMYEKFQMSAMGELNFFLGLQVLQKKDSIFLSQDKYGKDRTGKDINLHLYRSIIGSLMYLTASRPDIMFTVCACARHQVTPKKCHMHTVKRIFRYLKGHPKLRLWYPKESPFDLVAYSDSDYGGATQDCKSTTRGCQFLGRRLISWKCKKQTIMATSTTKAEYTDDNVADLLTKPFNVGRFQYLVVEHAMRGSVLGKYIIYTAISWTDPTDFVEASHLRYALTFNPTVYVSHIRQFWSTARIETTDEGTKILATVDGKLRTISESSIMRNLKHKDEAGISSLPDAKLFENLTLMGYNISPNQKQYTRRDKIAQSLALPPVENEHASLIGDDSQGEACPTDSGLEAEQDKANITKTSTLPSKSTPRVTSLAADDGSMQQQLNELTNLCTRLQRQQEEMASKITAQDMEISQLKARVKLLEDREGGGFAQSGEDASIKGRSLDKGEEAAIKRSTEKGSNDTEEMVNVLTSLNAATVLSSGVSVSISPIIEVSVAEVPTCSCFIPTSSPPGTGVPTGGVPTGSDVVPTARPIFTTATVATPYTRRKCKEKTLEEEMERDAQRMNEQIARDAKIAKIHAEEELQIIIDGLDRSNETIAKYLQEYYQFVAELPIGERIELIKESERFKRKGIRLEQDSAKKLKTSEEHFDREDLNQLWALVKETLNIRPATNDKEKELWLDLKRLYEPYVEDQLWTHTQNMMHAPVEWKLYDTCKVHHVIPKDQEMFMLVEKDYRLRKGLAIVMISYKLQVKNYSQMVKDLILKIHKIANSPRKQDD